MPDHLSVSIIIPTFNRPELLLLSVKSAIAALPRDGEIIVADDQSDPPAEITLQPIDHPALHVSVNAGARGAAANRNQAVNRAQGDLLVFLDDDDLLLPDYPARVVDFATANPKASWGFSPTLEHDAQTTSLPADPACGTGFQGLDDAPLKRRLAGLGCGFWIRRSLFLEFGGIDEDLTVNEDTDFCLQLLSRGFMPFRALDAGVSLLRLSSGGLTSGTPHEERARCFRVILDRHRDFLRTSGGHGFILRRYLKLAAKSRRIRAGFKTGLGEGPVSGRPANVLYFLMCLVIYLPGRVR